MSTFLFDEIIFGPVKSRRMGVSLGVNLLPKTVKYCNFNCVYCECGLTPLPHKDIMKLLPSRDEVRNALQTSLHTMQHLPDAITFAGNGEPTIHPEFVGIIDDVIEMRNSLAPKTEIVVLTNATQIHKPHIIEALSKVNRCMFKLDSAISSTIQSINQPNQTIDIEKYIENLRKFTGKIIMQTLFIRGTYNGVSFDNTTDAELDALIAAYKRIEPHEIVVYGIQRDTPISTLTKTSKNELISISNRIQKAGFTVSTSY